MRLAPAGAGMRGHPQGLERRVNPPPAGPYITPAIGVDWHSLNRGQQARLRYGPDHQIDHALRHDAACRRRVTT